MVFLYFLIDPRTADIRYVGYSVDPVRRFNAHLHPKGDCHRDNWIRQLQTLNLMPRLEVFDVVDDFEKAKLAEILTIKALRDQGVVLTNATDGGDAAGGRNEPDSPETRERKGIPGRLPKSALTKERMRLAHARRSLAASAKRGAKISAQQMGHAVPQEVRDKISRTLTGRVGWRQTPESKAANSRAQIGRPKTEAQRAAMQAGWDARRRRLLIEELLKREE